MFELSHRDCYCLLHSTDYRLPTQWMCVGVLICMLAQALRLPAGCNDDDRNPLHVGKTSETNPLAVTVFCRIGMTRVRADNNDDHYWYARHYWPACLPASSPHLHISTPTYWYASVLRVPCHLDPGSLVVSYSCSCQEKKALRSSEWNAGWQTGITTRRGMNAVISWQLSTNTSSMGI
jgi:hypothetical protein